MGRLPPRWVPGAFPKFIRLIELGMVVDTTTDVPQEALYH